MKKEKEQFLDFQREKYWKKLSAKTTVGLITMATILEKNKVKKYSIILNNVRVKFVLGEDKEKIVEGVHKINPHIDY